MHKNNFKMDAGKLNGIITNAYANAVDHGFFDDKLSNEHYLCLVVCELSEAVDAKRKRKRVRYEYLKDVVQILQPVEPTDENVEQYYASMYKISVKDTLDDELADAYIRLCSLAGHNKIASKGNNGLHTYIVHADNTFTENVMAITSVITDDTLQLKNKLFFCMEQIERLAELENVDLPMIIQLKMQYNIGRDYKHGNAF